jgi:hypothetical protein
MGRARVPLPRGPFVGDRRTVHRLRGRSFIGRGEDSFVTAMELARLVLNDCRYVLSKHTPDLQAEELRVSWVAVITLLSTVNDVLARYPKTTPPHLETAINTAFARLKAGQPNSEPAIYWSFIRGERHKVVHEYEIGFSRLAGPPSPQLHGQVNVLLDVGSTHGSLGRVARARFSSPVVITSKLKSGPFGGRDEREVAAEAIEWWQQYLDEIDREADRLSSE